MNNEKKPAVAIAIAIIGALALVAVPVVSRLVDIYLPVPTPTMPVQLSEVSQLPSSTQPLPTATNFLQIQVTSAQPVLQPTPTKSLSKYESVSLQNIGVYDSGNLGLQAGTQNLENIDFEIGWLVTTRSEDTPNSMDNIVLDVRQSSSQVSKVHFLLQAGWGFVSNNTEIGTITLVFADGRRLDEPLKIAYNIRDWSKINTPLSAPNVKQAWNGVGWDGKTQGVVDMLTLNISRDYLSTYIVQIEIKDESIEKLNSLNPAIHLWAVTMER